MAEEAQEPRQRADEASANREVGQTRRDDEDDALGGEPPCMACLLDEDGLMPDAPRPVAVRQSGTTRTTSGTMAP